MTIDEKAAEEYLSGAHGDRYINGKKDFVAGQQHERDRIWAAISEIRDYSYTSSIRQQLSAIIFEGQEK